MSYILDALKKSEQEREQGKVPDIKTVHHHPTPNQQPRQTPWLYIILGSLLVVVGAVSAWVFYPHFPSVPVAGVTDQPESSPSVAAQQGLQQAQADAVTAPKKQMAAQAPVKPAPTPHQSKPVASPKKKPSKPNVIFLKKEIPPDQMYSTQPYHPSGNAASNHKQASSAGSDNKQTTSVPPAKNPDIVDVADLPSDVRRRLPDISFTGHVYSSVPSRRSVIINGKQMREGEFLNGDLKLERITSKGAVFSMGDIWFRLTAMQDWSNH